FGLSYTTFEYKNLKVTMLDNSVKITFEITNTGNFPGKEIAQAYIRAPKGKIDKPFQELKGFYKTRLLHPGETEKAEIEIDLESLASFDGEMWLVEKGEYEVRVGASSRNIKLTGKFVIREEKRWKRFLSLVA
ncbi:MAG: fibronectin type III-like domain-contianing protein, partial [Infirmifilum sp.]